MSSITMAADSTQSEIKDSLKGKKHKKNASKKKKKTTVVRSTRYENNSNSDCDSDMDLKKELRPIGGYLQDRELTVEHMFRSISGKKLKAMLPEILKPIPVNELKKLCIEQLECMSKKRISRILEGADPETISSTGTEEDSSLSDDDKHQDGSTDLELHSDNVISDNKEEESHIPVATAQSGDLASPQSCVSRSRSQSRSRSSSRSGSPGYESDNSATLSPQSSKNADVSDTESHRYNEAESSTEEILEEVVYEEVVLEDGDDLESILGHGSFLKGTKDARLKTVTAHRDDPADKGDEIMMIEREEREEQPEVISVKDSCEGRLITSAKTGSTENSEITGVEGTQVTEATSSEQSKLITEAGSLIHVTSTQLDSASVRYKGDVNKDNITGELETETESKTSVHCVTDCSTTDPEGQLQKTSHDTNMEDAELSARTELEEGEIEDSSSEHEETVDDQPEEELEMENENDEQVMESIAKSGSSEVMVQKVKDRTARKKKKVRVIKRIIKVIRKKPKLEGQSKPSVTRDVPKKLKVSHQTLCREDDEIPDSCRNTRIKTEPGSEQSAATSPRSSNPSKSTSGSSLPAKVKRDPSAAEPADLTSVSEKSLNQMEILELEMRARAIKAMLKKQEEKEKHVEPESKRRIKLKRKMTDN